MKHLSKHFLRLVKANGACLRIRSPLPATIHRHQLPFNIKPAWRDRTQQSHQAYIDFKELLRAPSSSNKLS